MALPDYLKMQKSIRIRLFQKSLEIARELRRQQQTCYVDFSGGSMKSQMRMANRMKAAHVLIIGEDELARDSYAIKRMKDSRQWEVTLAELGQYLQSGNAQD